MHWKKFVFSDFEMGFGMDYLNKIYSKMPIFAQNALVSIYGAKLYYERYLFRDKGFDNDLYESQWYSEEIIRKNQIENFLRILSHSFSRVPYYKNLAKNNGINLDSIKTIDDISLLPTLSKETVRENVSSLLDKSLIGKSIKVGTSGSTGKTLEVYVDLEARRKAYSFMDRFYSWAGLESARGNVTIGGRAVVPQGQLSKQFWRYNFIMNNYLFSSYHLSEDTIPYYIEKINSVKPKFIESYPSNMYLLAKFASVNNMRIFSPTSIITTGETLHAGHRKLIEDVFKTKIFDQYGCTEQTHFVTQCEMGAYHVHPEYGYLELLNDDGAAVGPGEVGRVVCTGFLNKVMPLIRYEVGDLAKWGGGNCSCGRNFPIVEKIIGREDDYLKTLDGRVVGRLDPVFKGLSTVVASQIVQYEDYSVVVRVVPGKGFSSEDQDKIRHELCLRLGDGIDVRLELVEEIDRSSGGKLRMVKSYVKE